MMSRSSNHQSCRIFQCETVVDIVEKIHNEGNYGSPNFGFEHEYHTQHSGFDYMEMSYAPPMSNSSRKRKANEMSESNVAEAIMKAIILLKETMFEIGEKLSKSFSTEKRLKNRVENLDVASDKIEGLIEDEREIALR
ncbi:hypothetical protein PTKIN_Ptkin03bG0064900 [Pterospermum kingtungense]